MGIFGKAIVPAYESSGRMYASKVFAGDAELSVLRCAVCKEQGVIVGADEGEWQLAGVFAQGDIADKGEVYIGRDLIEGLYAVLKLAMSQSCPD